jgi:hypothetical protein
MSAQLSESLCPIDGVAGLHLLDALSERLVQAFPLFIVETQLTVGEHIFEQHHFDHLALGQVGRFVEDETAVADMGSKGLHRQPV